MYGHDRGWKSGRTVNGSRVPDDYLVPTSGPSSEITRSTPPYGYYAAPPPVSTGDPVADRRIARQRQQAYMRQLQSQRQQQMMQMRRDANQRQNAPQPQGHYYVPMQSGGSRGPQTQTNGRGEAVYSQPTNINAQPSNSNVPASY
jgi:hypothetical protein